MEPTEIEEVMCQSSLIQNIVVLGQVSQFTNIKNSACFSCFCKQSLHSVIVTYALFSYNSSILVPLIWQDQRRLGALVVANKDELYAAAKERMQAKGNTAEPSDADLRACIREELRT